MTLERELANPYVELFFPSAHGWAEEEVRVRGRGERPLHLVDRRALPLKGRFLKVGREGGREGQGERQDERAKRFVRRLRGVRRHEPHDED